ncbi:MAG: tetratricopeptide repeat protein [Rikenellaceae bacterium]
MKFYRYIILALFSLLSLSLYGQELPERALLRKGNRDFEKGEYASSVERYREALSYEPQSYEINYNLGSALFKADSAQQAVKVLQPLAQDTLLTDNQRAEVLYNMGNIAFEGNDLQAALDNYKSSLRLNPDDAEAKYNYAYTKKMLEQQQNEDNEDNQDQEQEQNEDNQEQNQDQQEQNQDQNGDGEDEQNQEQNQDQNQEQQEQNQDQNQDQGGNDEQEQDGGQQPQGGMSEQQQEQILDAIQAQEDKTQEKLDREEAQGVLIRGAKNW